MPSHVTQMAIQIARDALVVSICARIRSNIFGMNSVDGIIMSAQIENLKTTRNSFIFRSLLSMKFLPLSLWYAAEGKSKPVLVQKYTVGHNKLLTVTKVAKGTK